MKSWKMVISLAFSLALAGASFVFFQGCEDDPSTDVDEVGSYAHGDRSDDPVSAYGMTLSPGQATVEYVNQQISFNVEGGTLPLSWSLESSSVGSITVNSNNRDATYLAKILANNTLTVTDSEGHAISARLISAIEGNLEITPTTVTLTSGYFATNMPAGWTFPADLHGSVINFIVTGGTPPYTYEVTQPDLGTINSSGVYVSRSDNGLGDNGVVAIDAAGNKAEATVTTQFKQP